MVFRLTLPARSVAVAVAVTVPTPALVPPETVTTQEPVRHSRAARVGGCAASRRDRAQRVLGSVCRALDRHCRRRLVDLQVLELAGRAVAALVAHLARRDRHVLALGRDDGVGRSCDVALVVGHRPAHGDVAVVPALVVGWRQDPTETTGYTLIDPRAATWVPHPAVHHSVDVTDAAIGQGELDRLGIDLHAVRGGSLHAPLAGLYVDAGDHPSRWKS